MLGAFNKVDLWAEEKNILSGKENENVLTQKKTHKIETHKESVCESVA